jgi:hypothetical protein
MHIEISHGETVTVHLPGGGLVTIDAWNHVVAVEGGSPAAAQWLVHDRRSETRGDVRQPAPAAPAEAAGIRAAFDNAIDAIRASPDAVQAFRDASALGDLAKQMEVEAAGVRAFLAARLAGAHALSVTKLGKLLGVSRSRAAQLVKAGRSGGHRDS